MKRIFVYHGFAHAPSSPNHRLTADFEQDLRVIAAEGGIVTFDDGIASQYDIGVRVLRRNRMVGWIFVPTNLVGTRGFMSWKQLRELFREGFRIESHAQTHRDLTTLSPPEIRAELLESIKRITFEIGQTPTLLAFPRERTNPIVNQIVREVGLEPIGPRVEVLANTLVCPISDPRYWNSVYSGKVRAEPGTRPLSVSKPAVYDRYVPVLELVEGQRIADVGAGDAGLCKRIRAEKRIVPIAVDFSAEAAVRSGYRPYEAASAYALPFADNSLDLVICCQALEYMDAPEKFLSEARRVADKIIITTPRGCHPVCSQLREYSADGLRPWLENFGTVEVCKEVPPAMVIAKVILYKMKRLHAENINTPEHYDEKIWPDRLEARPYFDSERHRALTARAVKGSRVLDIGAGVYGSAQWLLERKGLDCEAWAVDISQKAREIVFQQCPKLHYSVGSIDPLPFRDNYFDVVTAGELVEHLDAPAALIREMARVCHSGGWMTISTVDTKCEAAIAHGDYPEHVWEFTPKDLLDLFQPYGEASYSLVGHYHVIECKKR
jgi:ubiquinone/menaquinone biosynthesis C-methylase UbiE/peptidoglycan/xylan/chitin deacetylase (PgdA/CDA1 family)